MDVSSVSFLEGGSLFEQEYNVEFHGQQYVVNLEATASLLRLEVEQGSCDDYWCGEFTSQYIEEITHKAGNHKKFGVFVKMLCSAFARESDSVFIDFLTYSDLEQLKARKLGTSLSSTQHRNTSKRYFILTYNNEFDRVHFPLPVSLQDAPSVEALRRVIRRLRKRLAEKERELVAPSSVKEKEQQQILSLLRQENTELKHRLRQLESREHAASSTVTTTAHKYQSKIDKLKKDLLEATHAYDKLRHDSAREITKLKHKMTSANTTNSDKIIMALKRQVQSQKSEIESLKQKVSRQSSVRQSTYSSQRSSRSASPQHRATYNSQSTRPPPKPTPSSSSRGRRSSSPASSSLGQRFDPTAYVRARQEKSRARSSSFGSSRRYSDSAYESGYSSAASNSSAGSRRSNRSTSTRASSVASTTSRQSDKPSTSKKRRHKKKSSKSKQHNEATVTSQLIPTSATLPAKHKTSSRYRDRYDDDVVNYYDTVPVATAPAASKPSRYISAYESDEESIEPLYPKPAAPRNSQAISTNTSSMLLMSKDIRQSVEKEDFPTTSPTIPSERNVLPKNDSLQTSKELRKSSDRDTGPSSTNNSPAAVTPATPPSAPISVKNENESISDIDKRISALQKFLDKASKVALGLLAHPRTLQHQKLS